MCHEPDIDAELALHGYVCFQPGAIPLIDNHDHARMREYGRTADNAFEMLEDAQTLLGHACGQSIRVVLPDDSTGFAAGTGAQKRFLQKDDGADVPARQRVSDAYPHDTAADDHDIARLHGDCSPG